MKPDLSAYLSFAGRAREALTFYASVLGGELTLETYGAYGASACPAEDDLVLYGVLRTPEGFVLRATDRPLAEVVGGGSVGDGGAFALCLNGDEADLLIRCWDRLAAGSAVVEPLEQTPWGDRNGVLRDPFGVLWIVNIGESL